MHREQKKGEGEALLTKGNNGSIMEAAEGLATGIPKTKQAEELSTLAKQHTTGTRVRDEKSALKSNG